MKRAQVVVLKAGYPYHYDVIMQSIISDKELIPAETAVEALCQVDEKEVATVLGFPLITKAEPYTAQAQALMAHSASTHTNWLIGAVIVSTILALVILLALLLLLHRYKREETKHRRLLPSPGPSSQEDQNQPCSLSPEGSVSSWSAAN